MRDFEDDALSIKGFFPLYWSPAKESDIQSVEQLMAANEFIFRTLPILEETRRLHSEDHEPQVLDALRRLETKVDLLMLSMAQVMTHYKPMPPKVAVVLHANRLEWLTHKAPKVGEHLCIEIYLNTQFPSPLVFLGQVTASQPEGREHRVAMHFDALGEAVQDWLERTIFRHHRREIRRQRSQAEQTSPVLP